MNIEKERNFWNILQSTKPKERATEKIIIEYATKYHRENKITRIHEIQLHDDGTVSTRARGRGKVKKEFLQ